LAARATLNLGILAHVDAGKTSLTERLLHTAGVIDAVGSVDHGDTQTDTLALERQRGITIRSAVVSFPVDGVHVNLIDTPGHPDFIAEVERALAVLDGAVLVISAVEGVQAQTRVLMRTLRRLGIPTLLFVNKIDRLGADPARVLAAITERLSPAVAELGSVDAAGPRDARFRPYADAGAAGAAGHRRRLVELLAEDDDGLLAAYVEDRAVPYRRLRRALAEQTCRARVHPVLFGSAMTGAGVPELAAAVREFLPATEAGAETDAGADADAGKDGPLSATVFKIERGPGGEKLVYVRVRSGTLRLRDRVRWAGSAEGQRVTAINVFDGGPARPGDAVSAGQIAKLSGLSAARVGDELGTGAGTAAGPGGRRHFAPPTLETVVVPRVPAERGALHLALAQLAEQDPLIGLRQDDLRQEISVSLYGEVQKEVVQATLAEEFGLAVSFRETTTICVERPVGTGGAAEYMDQGGNPFRATVGLRVEPGPTGSGVRFRLGVELGSMPHAFFRAVEESARAALGQGLYGWQVIDCTVTLTRTGFVPPPPYGWSKWSSSAGDFRALTPLVLMRALAEAGTRVHEPVHGFRLEAPSDLVPAVLPALSKLGAVPRSTEPRGPVSVLTGELPAAAVHPLEQRLPALTRGEGLLESAFTHYRAVPGAPPRRPRTDHNPLDRREYLRHAARHH
jgi:ribosomal protection tetracycline resistance protein